MLDKRNLEQNNKNYSLNIQNIMLVREVLSEKSEILGVIINVKIFETNKMLLSGNLINRESCYKLRPASLVQHIYACYYYLIIKYCT